MTNVNLSFNKNYDQENLINDRSVSWEGFDKTELLQGNFFIFSNLIILT